MNPSPQDPHLAPDSQPSRMDRERLGAEAAAAAELGEPLLLASLLRQGADPSWDDWSAIRLAAHFGQEACVELLIPLSDIAASRALREAAMQKQIGCARMLAPFFNRRRDGHLMRLAAFLGSTELIEILLPYSPPKLDHSAALAEAARAGHAACVALLAPLSDPQANGSRALAFAAEHGHIDCFEILLPLSNPKGGSSLALRMAAKAGHAEMVSTLLPLSDPDARGSDGLTASDLARARGHAHIAAMLEAHIQAQYMAAQIPPSRSAPSRSL